MQEFRGKLIRETRRSIDMSPTSLRVQGDELSKTRRCQFYLEGRCKYDVECTYAHSTEELREAPKDLKKTKMCDLFVNGLCLDNKCNFAHDPSELRSRRESRPSVRRHSSVSSDVETIMLLRQIASLLQAKTPTPASAAPPGFDRPSLLGYQAGVDNMEDTLNRIARLSLSCTDEEEPVKPNPGFSLY